MKTRIYTTAKNNLKEIAKYRLYGRMLASDIGKEIQAEHQKFICTMKRLITQVFVPKDMAVLAKYKLTIPIKAVMATVNRNDFIIPLFPLSLLYTKKFKEQAYRNHSDLYEKEKDYLKSKYILENFQFSVGPESQNNIWNRSMYNLWPWSPNIICYENSKLLSEYIIPLAKMLEDLHSDFQTKLCAYNHLIDNARHLEDLAKIWPEADEVRLWVDENRSGNKSCIKINSEEAAALVAEDFVNAA